MSLDTINGPYDALVTDFDRMKKRHKHCKKSLNDNITKVIDELQTTLKEIQKDDSI